MIISAYYDIIHSTGVQVNFGRGRDSSSRFNIPYLYCIHAGVRRWYTECAANGKLSLLYGTLGRIPVEQYDAAILVFDTGIFILSARCYYRVFLVRQFLRFHCCALAEDRFPKASLSSYNIITAVWSRQSCNCGILLYRSQYVSK